VALGGSSSIMLPAQSILVRSHPQLHLFFKKGEFIAGNHLPWQPWKREPTDPAEQSRRARCAATRQKLQVLYRRVLSEIQKATRARDSAEAPCTDPPGHSHFGVLLLVRAEARAARHWSEGHSALRVTLFSWAGQPLHPNTRTSSTAHDLPQLAAINTNFNMAKQ